MSKIVLITGASSGIGKTIAIFLTNKGFKVYGTCRNPKKYNISEFSLLKCNINSKDEIEDTINFIIDKENKIDILINNAGKLINKPFKNISRDDLYSVFDVNVFGVFNLIQKLLPFFIKEA